MKPCYVIFALVLFVGVVGLFAFNRKELQVEISALDARPSSGTASARSDHVKEPHTQRSAVNATPAEAPPSTPEEMPTKADSAADPTPPVLAVNALQTMNPEEVRVRLDGVFQADLMDRTWTDRAQETVLTRISAVLPETSRLRTIECRTSMCRIETAHADADSYRRFLLGVFQEPSTKLWNGGSFATPLPGPHLDQDGRVVTVAYIAREGQPLPAIGVDRGYR